MKCLKNSLGMLLLVLMFGIIAAGCTSTQSFITTAQENPSIISAGTGFFITADGYVVTCAHVIEDSSIIGVWVNGNRYPAELVAIDIETDVAILKINYRPSRYFRLANFASANLGDRVYVLGFPWTNILGSEIRLTDGIISAFSGIESNQTDFQISAPVQPGNSGGPVFNERFEVLGITASKLNRDDAQNVNFAVKNTFITSILPRNVRVDSGNVRNMQEAVIATVQISVDDIFEGPPGISSSQSGPSGPNIVTPSPSGPTPPGQIGTVFSGTYYFSSGYYLTFNGNNFTVTTPRETVSGTYRISGNSIVFSRSMYGSSTWVIVDSNTLRDPDGDIWKKQETALSGTYYFSSSYRLTFNGSNFSRTDPTGTISGTYRVSGNSIIFSRSMYGSDTWVIVD